MMAVNGTKDLGKQERASSENGKQAFNDKHSNFDAVYSVALKDITNAIEKSKESKQPQFRSIIPCEVLLYIEVTFLGFIH